MKRYFKSFVIASFFYIFFAFGIFYFFIDKELVIKDSKTVQKISLNHIDLKPEQVVNQIKEEIKKDIKEEPKVKELKKEENKKVQDKPKEQKIKKELVVKKDEFQEQKTPIKEESTKENVATNVQKETPKVAVSEPIIDEKKEYLDKNLTLIRDLINQNIKYPPMAKKLSIQGVVSVRFKINEKGIVENITILEGHKFLQNATIEAIEEASKNFPKTNKSIEIQIPIEYKLI